uniref:Pirin n=1 Tax=Neobodo designis TaxID=312471 RepID=A0A7S1MCV2_NEODS|mmetsp:Transcript_3691/g.11661  ORF Transcript_3691/g.11661 Transcript_3691/m.11661 type:complete len:338 (+) Transcript_3691:38-1051(+)|eukprot:CAMPEP_0174855736 /NCGR_PEP_ID=MMETSP1114-20130205/34074_1 /TAXON_ID=312471 /ORGANISM="Neobodo designis, Strain CCAP 1951/1" /LENGTH=337 /DNA_ID=CAMNT_0016090497 /DNA_START=33 /DNA_END=1046 /DNA_ORIENTATION=+
MPSRRIVKIFTAHRQREGAGFIVTRPFPSANLKDADTDPFLMLDALGPTMVDHRSPGAPWHPHRGFDTVTYFKRGAGAHQDSMGNKGVVKEGEVQWMRAGSGVIHDEGNPGLTRDDPPRPSQGFQLWVNLPARLKMSPPDYQQLTAETFVWRDYVAHGSQGTRVKVIAGDLSDGSDGVRSPLNDALSVPVMYVDVDMKPGANAVIPIPAGYETALVFVYAGSVRVFNGDKDAAGSPANRADCIVYASDDGALRLATPAADEYAPSEPVPETPTTDDLEREAREYHGASLLVLAGQRIGEPVARHGPFVMNTDEELRQAFADYHSGKLATVKAQETKH